MEDSQGREAHFGDRVAVAVFSRRRAHLRLGFICGFPARTDYRGRRFERVKIRTDYPSTVFRRNREFVILSREETGCTQPSS